MKLETPIKCEDSTVLEEVNPTEHGVYCIFRVPNVKRGIRGKTRGSATGTQGLKGSKERSRIPDQFCDYIVELCERK